MISANEQAINKLRTPGGWFLCVQLDDLHSVCEHLYLRSGVRYTRWFHPPSIRLPFLIKDSPTEDASLRVLQIVEFSHAHQVICYSPSLRPRRFFRFKKADDLPDWIWNNPPYPHLDDGGYRHVCLGNAFFSASKDDNLMVKRWFDLTYKKWRLVYPSDYNETPMPYLILVSPVNDMDYAMVTTVSTADLIPLVKEWGYYLGMRQMPYNEQKVFSKQICRFINNLIRAHWPINEEFEDSDPLNTM